MDVLSTLSEIGIAVPKSFNVGPQDSDHEIISAYLELETNQLRPHQKILRAIKGEETSVNIHAGNKRFENIKGESNLLLAIKSVERTSPILVQMTPKSFATATINTQSQEIEKNNRLTAHQILELTSLARKIQQHLYFPQICEFAITKNQIYLTSLKPLTPSPVARITLVSNLRTKTNNPTQTPRHWQEIASGFAHSPGIKIGHTKNIKNFSDLNKVNYGDVIIVPKLEKQHLTVLSKAGAIVTHFGDRHDFFSAIVRKKGIPHVQLSAESMVELKDNQVLMVSGTEGKIYRSV